MNAIIGMTQLLLDTDLSDSQKELVEDIRGSGDHLIAIINDILDISKLEAGKIVLERQEISVRKCIEDAYRLTSRSFPNSKGRIDFKSEIRSDVPETIIGDSTRLTQILINLLSNAMKFTQHGFIRVSVSHATGITPSGATIATPQTHV
jgi:signal transduction histidine kinase